MSDENPLDVEAARLRSKLRLVTQGPRDEDITPESCGIDPEAAWKDQLIFRISQGKRIYPCRAHNLMLILEHDAAWKGRLRFDEFCHGIMDRDREWTDADLIELKAWFERHWIESEVKTGVVREAVETVAQRHAFHPIREWLFSLVWDGLERLPRFFTDFCEAPLTPYSSAVSRSLFVSAVARVLTPGSKVDTMIVLEGAQGIGKSKLVQALFGARWHCDITEEPGSLDFYQNLRGKWVGEFSELSAMGRADQNRVKQALTQTSDTYRQSYGHYSRTYPRQFVFIGNTNKCDYLADDTGARRYLPITCSEIDSEAVAAIRDQLWAEGLYRYQAGEIWWDIPDSVLEQEARYQSDSWEDYIEPWLKGKPRVLISEILEHALGLKLERHDRSAQTRVGAILRRLGWISKQATTASDRKRYYVRKGCAL
jgi:predicted P-loop ATPase